MLSRTNTEARSPLMAAPFRISNQQTVWGANSDRSRLAIITCDDAFGFRGDGHRVANFVVIADKV